MPFEAFKPVFKALPKLGFMGLVPALVITQCLKLAHRFCTDFQYLFLHFTQSKCENIQTSGKGSGLGPQVKMAMTCTVYFALR